MFHIRDDKENIMNYNKLEQLQNEFFEKLEHTHTVVEIKMLVEWYKDEKKKLESEIEKEETDEG